MSWRHRKWCSCIDWEYFRHWRQYKKACLLNQNAPSNDKNGQICNPNQNTPPVCIIRLIGASLIEVAAQLRERGPRGVKGKGSKAAAAASGKSTKSPWDSQKSTKSHNFIGGLFNTRRKVSGMIFSLKTLVNNCYFVWHQLLWIIISEQCYPRSAFFSFVLVVCLVLFQPCWVFAAASVQWCVVHLYW